MSRTVEELQQQSVRLRSYMGYFKNRMEGFLSTLQRTNRDLTLLLAPESNQLSLEEVRNTLKNAQGRIEAVVSAKEGVRIDVEAAEGLGQEDAHAIVIYFKTEALRDEMMTYFQTNFPGLTAAAIK